MPREPTLVILAAGVGRRYGEEKQIAAVGPDGEWLLEYAFHDALAASFTRVLMVIRASLREALQQRLVPHLRGRCELHLIEQSPDRVPAGCHVSADRSKPLGTGHALWCCKDLLHGPFAVINADDYYGRDAFALLAQHFRSGAGPAMVGYRLEKSLSPHGGVNRGLCRIDDGCLSGVEEFVDIHVVDDGLRGRSPAGVDTRLDPDDIVSLNCWGLLPDLLPDLESGLIEFLEHMGSDDEYFLPAAIDRHLARSGRRLAVLKARGEWLGLTYPQDRPRVAARLAAMHAAGTYPTPLWNSDGR
ncbi:MAG TPA: NTP transferase domain-containing protein [Rhodanobacteraceae bacterium]|nr:NTP transferase domain-containing protein [Rhodanobacteraceae bacterium]